MSAAVSFRFGDTIVYPDQVKAKLAPAIAQIVWLGVGTLTMPHSPEKARLVHAITTELSRYKFVLELLDKSCSDGGNEAGLAHVTAYLAPMSEAEKLDALAWVMLTLAADKSDAEKIEILASAMKESPEWK